MTPRALGIVELITRVGNDNVKIQNLLNNTTDMKLRKRGETLVSFVTDQVKPIDLISDKPPENLGLILWMPRKLVDEIYAAWQAEEPSHAE